MLWPHIWYAPKTLVYRESHGGRNSMSRLSSNTACLAFVVESLPRVMMRDPHA